MKTLLSQIDVWRAARSEHQRLEFKAAKAQFDNRKLYKYCVALANEGGGYLLLGTVYDFEGAYLMRAGEELVPMSEDRLRAIFAEGQPDWLSQPAMQACDDDRVVQLLDTQSYLSASAIERGDRTSAAA